MKKKRFFYRLAGITAAVLIAAMTLCLVLTPEKAYSGREKRMLNGFPVLTWESLKNGRFMDQIEDYAKDQFALRDLAADVRNGLKLLTGDRESNGVFYLKSGRLAERFTMPSDASIRTQLTEIRAFSAKNETARQYFLLVPTAAALYPEEIPDFADPDSQHVYIDRILRELPEAVGAVDVRRAFTAEKGKSELYYRTDHHWTTEGAKIAAEELLKAMGLSMADPGTGGVVSASFMGSLAAKSGFRTVTPDAVTIYPIAPKPEEGSYFTVTYADEQETAGTVYDAAALRGDDPYEVFFGGNHAEIEIRTSLETGRRLLLIKDSYANALIPFLIGSFDEISVVDPRYYRGNLDELTAEKGFTDIVFLYNANTLSEDTSLPMVLRNEQ